MSWRMHVLLALVVSATVVASKQEAEEHRQRRQSNIGAPVQFGIARPPQQLSPQLATRGSPQSPPLTFQLVQGYRQDERNGPVAQPRPSQQLLRPTQQPQLLRTRAPPHFIPTPGPRAQQQPTARHPQQQRGRLLVNQEELADELAEEAAEDLEEEKPDRLTQLLPLSKFDCVGRGTGYYADEELACEVFHYCQAGAKHSWICPEGFTFHQVHLICMPPGGDNICKKSSQFHFVNEYLYRPINAEEAQSKPNVTLRYADRYYPETYDQREDQAAAFLPQSQRQRLPAPPPQRTSRPTQPQLSHNQPTPLLRAVPQHQFQQRPTLGNQVFHSPEEVNIPLQHRRPAAVSGQQRSQQQNYGSGEEGEYDYDEQPYRQG